MLLASATGGVLAARPLAVQADRAVTLQNTAAEQAAGVQITDPAFAPGDIRRYGARGDGVSNDAPAFQAAIDVARLANRGSIYSPGGAGGRVYVPAPSVFYLLTEELNCTFAGGENQHGITMSGATGLSISSPAIIARHRGHVFDLSGCDSLVLENLCIGTDAIVYPETCFFLARNITGSSAGYHRFRNVRVHGKFKTAILYNYGSESNVYSECIWCNEASSAASKVAVFSTHNIFNLKSQFVPLASGPCSCIDHQVLGGNFLNISGDVAADIFYLDNIRSLKVFGPWLMAGIHAPGRALIYVDSTHGGSSFVELYGMQGEVGTTQQYGVYFGDEAANTATGWTIDGCFLPNSKRAVFAGLNTVLDSFHLKGVRELTSHGLEARAVQNSTIDAGALPLTLGVSRRNVLLGDSSGWRIGAREQDYWIDSGSTRKLWSPQLTGIDAHGTLQVTEAKCVFHGPLVTVGVTLKAAGVLQCAAGARVSGLPAPAAARSAAVNVADAESGEALGAGAVIDSSIVLPALSARRAITISATYFAA
jgi:hypothetical protein